MSPSYSGFASPEKNTLIQSQVTNGVSTNATNIVLVRGAWADGSSWSKVIPILRSAGHNVTAVQMPLNSLADHIDTVKRAIDHIGAPITLAGQMYSTGIKN
jgi:hypothetical protein